ncbi:MAG: transglutaminase-like domain-containing protein [Pirellulales bacterium]|nr:transglutaminase-like domain-containing protein [Pirellulales bacterium]
MLALRALVWFLVVLAATCVPGSATAKGFRLRIWPRTEKPQTPSRSVAAATRTASPPAAADAEAVSTPPLPADAGRLARDWASAHGFDLEPRTEEEALFTDLADGQLERVPLWDAALMASQVFDAARLGRYREVFSAWIDECRAQVDRRLPPLEQAGALFDLMHREILHGGYQVDCTDLAELIEYGRFNCVSSALLYGCLCQECGLDVRGVELPGHAYCIVSAGTRAVDVETTCPRWFAVLDDPARQQELLARTLGAAHPARRGGRRIVPLASLVGIIYYNRGVECLEHEQFAAALAANVKALRVDASSVSAWGNLLAAINNWSLSRSGTGEYAAAVRLLDQGAQLAPQHKLFQSNRLAIYQRWFEELAAADRSAEAVRLAESVDLSDAIWHDICLNVYRGHALKLASSAQLDDSLATLAAAKHRLGARSELASAEAEAISTAATAYEGQGHYEQALAAWQQGLTRRPGEPRFVTGRRELLIRWSNLALESGDFPAALARATWQTAPASFDAALGAQVRLVYQAWIKQLALSRDVAAIERVAKRASEDSWLVSRTSAWDMIADSLQQHLREAFAGGKHEAAAQLLHDWAQIESLRSSPYWSELLATAFLGFRDAANEAIRAADVGTAVRLQQAVAADPTLGQVPDFLIQARSWPAAAARQ